MRHMYNVVCEKNDTAHSVRGSEVLYMRTKCNTAFLEVLFQVHSSSCTCFNSIQLFIGFSGCAKKRDWHLAATRFASMSFNSFASVEIFKVTYNPVVNLPEYFRSNRNHVHLPWSDDCFKRNQLKVVRYISVGDEPWGRQLPRNSKADHCFNPLTPPTVEGKPVGH